MSDEPPNADPEREQGTDTGATMEGSELVSQLVDASVLTEDEAIDDLVLTDRFQYNWRKRIEQLRDRETVDFLGLLLEADPDTLTIERANGTLTVTREGETVGEWPSEAALVADVAAFVTLGEWLPVWDDLAGGTRDELVARLRAFLETCPACDGPLAAEEGNGGQPLPTIACEECGAVLL